MAGNRIKGITIEIGGDTTRLDRALSGVDRQLKTTQASLKDVERLLKMDPGNVELLAQKQRLLADAVSGTQERLRTLETAAEQANQALANGEMSQDQYDALRREIIETTRELEELTRAADDFDIDQAIRDAENRLDDLRDAADDATDELEDLDDASGGSGLKGLAGVAAGAALEIGAKLVNALTDAVNWMWTLDEATEEYRVAMGKLNTAYEVAGFNAETARVAYQGFYNILGDTDTATEASQLLAQLAEDEQDVAKWTEIAAGVYGTFGDSIPIEGLIEAANETAKTGQVTGVLADALNWVGISEDEFNEKLQFTSDAGYRAKMIMDELTHTYKDAADAFYENNEALIESREAQSALDESMAEVGQAVADVKTALLDTFGPTLNLLLEFAADVFTGIAGFIRGLGDVVDWLGEKISGVVDFFRELLGLSQESSGAVASAGMGGTARSGTSAYSMAARTSEDVPWLAQGAVTRPNSPFLAVVGDNPTESEVIAPYSTIKQAVGDAMTATGGRSGPIQININYTGNLAQLMRLLDPHITVEQQRLGPQFVT